MGEGKQETGLCRGKDQKSDLAGNNSCKLLRNYSEQNARRMREDDWSFPFSTLPCMAAEQSTQLCRAQEM